MASISHRYSIRWLPDNASEPTSTLVLTLASGFYIDVRFQYKETEAVPPCLRAADDPLLKSSNSNPPVEVEWAFAGQSTSTKGPPRESTWQHWVDSRTSLFAEKLFEDSGKMFPREDGMTLEKGSMVNPETGKETKYEEIWEDPPLEFRKNMDYEYFVLTHDDITKDTTERSRGAMVQLGEWCQAVYRSDTRKESGELSTKFYATRWRWTGSEFSYRVGSVNSLLRPDSTVAKLRKENAAVGTVMEIDGREWTCKELSKTRS